MTRGTLMVRLLGGAVVSFASCIFVNLYAELSNTRFKVDHPDGQSMTPFNEFVLTNGGYAYTAPLALLLLGVIVVWRWPNAYAIIELVVSTMWIMAFVWFAVALLSWQAQNTPVFTGMRLHY
jgi:hypothetical protein